MGGIYDLPYPGIFQHPFCMAGFTLLFHPSDHLSDKRKQRILQPLLRPGAAVQPAGRALWTVPEKGHSQVNEKQKGTESTPQPCYSATRLHLFCQRKTTQIAILHTYSSSEIPATVPFPALPKTALWREFLRFQPRPAALGSRLGPPCGRLLHGTPNSDFATLRQLDIGRTPIISNAALPSWCGSDVKTNSGGQGVKALASAVSICLFDFALCFLPLCKLPLALFAAVIFPYLRNGEPGKGFYNSLRKFDFTVCFIGSLFRQRHFPFPKRRTRPAGGRNRERVSCSPPPLGPVISSRREWRG